MGVLAACSAVAGAFAERLSLVLLAGGINSNDLAATDRIVHHSLALPEKDQVLQMMRPITAHACRIANPRTAAADVDHALAVALRHRRPVYIEVCCNLAAYPVCAPAPIRISKFMTSNKASLLAVVEGTLVN